MRVFSAKAFLSLTLYGGLAFSSYASVSRDGDDLIAGIAGTSSNQPSTPQHFNPQIIIPDSPKISSPFQSQIAQNKDQKLNQIIALRGYFKKGLLEITPKTCLDLLQYAVSYKEGFAAYDRGISLRGWSNNDETGELVKLFYHFNTIKSIKCRKNTWQPKVLVNTLGDAIQYYEGLEILDLKDSVLNDKEITKLLKVLPNPSCLKSLNIKTSVLEAETINQIKKKYPQLEELVVGEMSSKASDKKEMSSLQDTTVLLGEMTIEQQKVPSLPFFFSSLSLKSQSSAVTPSKESSNEENLKTAPLSLASKKLTNEDILGALNKVKAKTLPIEDFIAFVKSDPSFKTLNLGRPFFSSDPNSIGNEGAKILSQALKEIRWLTKLDLSNNQVGAEGIIALGSALKGMTSITELNLWGNPIGDEGIAALSQSFNGMTSLNLLDLSGNQIENKGIIALMLNLKELKSLASLNLSFNKFDIKGIPSLAQGLKEMSSLTTLNLSSNKLEDTGAALLTPGLKAMTSLTSLDLGSNEIKYAGTIALASILPEMKSLTTLSLAQNKIGIEAVAALSQAFTGVTPITSLNLSGTIFGASDNPIDDEGAKVLVQALKGMTSLTNLNFIGNPFGNNDNAIDDKGAKVLAQALKEMASIACLSLPYNQIGDEGAKALAKTIMYSSSLNYISLNSNCIGSEGIKALTEAKELKKLSGNAVTINTADQKALSQPLSSPLEAIAFKEIPTLKAHPLSQPFKKLTDEDMLEALNKVKEKKLSVDGFAAFIKSDLTLKELNLNFQSINDEGAKAVAEAIKQSTSLTHVNLASNLFGNEGAKAIADAIKNNQSLTYINISSNFISLEGAKALAEAIKNSQSLTYMDITLNFIGDEGAKVLAEAIEPPALQGKQLFRARMPVTIKTDKKITSFQPSLPLFPAPVKRTTKKLSSSSQPPSAFFPMPTIDMSTLKTMPLKEEEKPQALPLYQPSRTLNADDILDAINKVKAKTLSVQDFAVFMNSDPTLTKIDLCRSRGSKEEPLGVKGTKAMAEALKQNKTLTKLNLGLNSIDAEGAKAMAEALKQNKTLTELRLGDNSIGAEGAKAMAETLKQNTTLTTVYLPYNSIGAEGTKAMAEALKQNTTLATVDLFNNSIGDEGAKALAEALKQNTTLATIDLSDNAIGAEGAKVIAEALKQNTALTKVDLRYNRLIGDEGERALADLKRNRPSLSIKY